MCQIGIPGCNNIFWRRAGWLPDTIYSIYTYSRSNLTFLSHSIYCTRCVHLSFSWPDTLHSVGTLRAHFTHEPRAMTRKLWEPKRKCLKAVPRHLQNHVVWSRTLKCSVKSYVTMPSSKCYFCEFLYVRVLTHDEIEEINVICERLECYGLLVLC